MTLDPMRSTSHFIGSPEDWLIWKENLLKSLDGQSISTGPLRYTFTERLLTGDTKATFNQTDLDIGIHMADSFNKVLAEIVLKCKFLFSLLFFLIEFL